MNNLDLPPFPILGASGPLVCESVRFYLAIVDDLPFEQVRVLSEHVKGCRECAREFRLLQRTTHMVASLPESMPSARVDDAVLAAIHSRQRTNTASVELHPEKQGLVSPQKLPSRARAPFYRRRMGMLALAAALLLVLVLAGVFLRGLILPSGNTQAFHLPAHLSWNGYVLHYTQTRTDAHGKTYQVEVYQDLGTNQMHIESTMQGKFDVVVVTDQQDMLGEDMMHHVAQKGNSVENWAVDGSLFDLNLLRQDLSAQHAVYLGQSTFQGQKVYQIRASNGQVLLLNRQYFPVNALQSGTNTPIYTNCALMPTAQVSDSMWDMQVPSGFRMGQLPAKS